MPELSIIIPCYIANEELLQLTKNTIHSLKAADLPGYEIIIIDDNSPMGSGYLKEQADTYIYHRHNKGFIKSINDGIAIARGKYLLLTNNDVRIAPNFWEVCFDILRDEGTVSVHPRMCFYDEEMKIGDKTFATGMERWCQSSCFVIRNNGFPFPEHFKGTGGAYEDWYFWSEIRSYGLQTAYTTKTCFQHKDSSTTQIVGEQSKHHEENRELFKEEFGDYPEEYYNKLYPKQMARPWREEFTKL